MLQRLFSFNFYLFSTKILDRKVKLHKAVIASNIVRTIQSAPNLKQNDVQISLKKRVQNCINQYNGLQYQKNSPRLSELGEKYLLRFFNEGTNVDLDLYSQERVKFAQLTMRDGKDKLSFCPTYTVTQQVFRMLNNNTSSLLITGQYGIAKTFSFILYNQLSKLIYQYLNVSTQEDSEKLKSQIYYKVKRTIYWTINMYMDNRCKILQNMIIKQCFQFEAKQLRGKIINPYEINSQSYKQFDKERVILGSLYRKKGISLCFLIDQINKLEEVFKDRQALIDFEVFMNNPAKNASQKNKKNKSTHKSKTSLYSQQIIQQKLQYYNTYKQQIIENYKIAQLIIDYKSQLVYVNNIDSIVHLSPIKIESKFLQILKIGSDVKHKKVTQLQITNLSYGQEMLINDLEQFIYFRLKQNIKTIQLNYEFEGKVKQFCQYLENNQKQIKQNINKYLKANYNFFITPLSISQNLLNKQSKKKLEQILKSDEQMSDKFTKLINFQLQKIHKTQKSQIQDKVLQFIYKDKSLKQQKQRFLYQLYIMIQMELKKINNDCKISKTYFQFQLSCAKQSTNYSISDIIYWLFFNYKSAQNSIKCLYPGQVLVDILRNIVSQFNRIIFFSHQSFFNLIKNNRTAYGIIFQNVFLDAVSKGSTNFRFSTHNKQHTTTLYFDKISSHLCGFVPIPQTNSKIYDNYYFLHSFLRYTQFWESLSQKNEVFMMIPLQQKYLQFIQEKKQFQVSQSIIQKGAKFDYKFNNSKKIDLIFTKSYFSPINNQNCLQIFCFDLTISKSQILEKWEGFLQEFMNFQDKCETQIANKSHTYLAELFYFVISFENPEIFFQDYQKYMKGIFPKLKKKWQILFDQLDKKTIKDQTEKRRIKSLSQKIKLSDEIKIECTSCSESSSAEISLNSGRPLLLSKIGFINFNQELLRNEKNDIKTQHKSVLKVIRQKMHKINEKVERN